MITRRTAAVAIAGLAAAAVPLAAAAPVSAHSNEPTVHGCRSGYVCLYKYDNFRGTRGTNRPDAEFYSYGVHRIYGFTVEGGSTVDNQYGFYSSHDRYQYFGGACYYRHSNGTDFYMSDRGFPAQADGHADLFPVNSVTLVKETPNREDYCPNR